jgi:hypothetical protein
MAFWGGWLALALFCWNLAAVGSQIGELHFWTTLFVVLAVGMETVALIGFVFIFVMNLNDLRKNTTRIREGRNITV